VESFQFGGSYQTNWLPDTAQDAEVLGWHKQALGTKRQGLKGKTTDMKLSLASAAVSQAGNHDETGR
jgi:hypothetical protein